MKFSIFNFQFSNKKFQSGQSGQVLLIAVMLLATVLTVVLSLSFKTTTETTTAKLEAENQKTLAAAEAAIEATLKSGQAATLGTGNLSSLTGFTGGATIATTQGNSFTSPLLLVDEAYTFYLADYNNQTQVFGSSIAQNLTVCFSASTAVELTLFKTSSIKKYVVDSTGNIGNAAPSSGVCPGNSGFPNSFTIPAADISTDTKLLVARIFFSSGKIYISRSSNLPVQGQTVTSSASSTTGVSKSVELFQSYPQIPSEFFTTSF